MAIGAALSAIGGLVGGLASAGANLYMNERNNEANAAQARMQNQWNIEQWNRENEYNLPVNQVQRMKDAGINPGLAYANGQMMNEAAQSPDMTSAAGQLRSGYIDPMLMAQIGLVNAQKEKTETESDVMAQKLPEELNQMRLEQQKTQKLIEEVSQNITNMKEQVELMKSERNLNDEKIADIVWQQSQRDKEFQHVLDKWETERKELLARIDRYESQNKLDKAEINLKESIRRLNRQEFEYNIIANPLRLAGLRLDNTGKKMDTILKIDTHKMYGQQITLNGYDIINGRLNAEQNQASYDDYSGKNGFFNKISSRVANDFLWGVSTISGAINFRLLK